MPAYLVFGAAGGIGSALARRLAASGATLTVTSRSAARAQPLADELGATCVEVDAADFDAVDRCVRDAADRSGGLDGVANCAGSLLLKPAHLTRADELAATVAANLTTAFAITRAAARTMSDGGGGSIALVSSAAARVGLANHEAVAAAKAGVEGLALAAAATYAARHVRVNCVAPGLVRTPLTARITGSPAAAQASLAMHAIGRLGEPDDVAAALAWLLDPATSWVTGQVLGVDGGLGSVRAR